MSDTESQMRCTGCGRAGTDEACEASFQALTGQSFIDARFGRLHGIVVDTYCLQHPDKYCVSAKSLAAHLCGLCGALERGESAAMPNMALRAWLDGKVDLEKPALPSERGDRTIAEVEAVDDPGAYETAVRDWASSVWSAYEPLHPKAREWLDAAKAAPTGHRHSH